MHEELLFLGITCPYDISDTHTLIIIIKSHMGKGYAFVTTFTKKSDIHD